MSELENYDDIDPKEIEELLGFMDSLQEKDDIDYNLIMDTFGLDIEGLEKEMENYVPRLDVGYKKSNENTVDPNYAYDSDSGFDLYSTEEIVLTPFGRALVPTGIHFDVPERCEIQVRPKSGLAIKQGLTVLNTPGTVDQGYTGEIQVIVFNTNNYTVMIPKGMKVAQAVLCPVINGKYVRFESVESLDEKDRGDNGFGSTGI